MKKKALFAIFAAMAVAATGFASGCGISHNDIIYHNTKKVSDVKNITYYGFKHEEKDLIAIESAIHGFMDIHPDINVNYEGIIIDDSATEDFYKIFDLRYASNHLDDVFMLKQDARMEKMLDEGDLLDLKGLINLSAYNELVKSQITYPNYEEPDKPHVYFVPMSLTSYCLYINYDLLNSWGKSVPTNFEEFAALCDYSVNEKGTTPIICNKKRSMRSIVQASGLYDLYQLENSVEVIDGYNTNPAPLADYLYNGLKLADDMLKNGWIDAAMTKTTDQASAKIDEKTNNPGDMYEFIKGKQPFMITGSWATNRITDKIKETGGKPINYGVHPLPFLSKEKGGNVMVFDIDVCTAVNTHSKNLDAAKEFISYFTNPASVWEFCNTNNSYSPLAEETRKPDNKTLMPCLDYYTNGQSVLGTNYRLYAFNLNDAIDAATKKLLNGESLESAYAQLLTGLGLGGEQ